MDLRVNLPKLRILPAPEERLRTLTKGADQAEALAEKARLKAEPYLETIFAVRRRIATGAVAILTVWLFVHVMFGANGMAVYRAKKAEYQQLQKEIDGLQKENDEYTQQVNELKTDPRRIEKEAREQFHYARPGEVIYVAPPQQAPASSRPATRTAQR
jgi:cell division protein FtsB